MKGVVRGSGRLSTDGRFLGSAQWRFRTVRLWNLKTRELIRHPIFRALTVNG